MILLAMPGRNSMMSPGALSLHHRHLADQCQACHVASDAELSGLVRTSFDAATQMRQSDSCLECHRDFGESPLQPHGVGAQQLASLTSVRKSDAGSLPASLRAAQSLLGTLAESHSELACAVCHQEHHGDVSLVELTNNQCQSCHTDAFHGFANGHPEFDQYVSKRRTRIQFDHVSHYGRHFPADHDADKSSVFSCNRCHVTGPSGDSMLVTDFSDSCASCHEEQIVDDSIEGSLMFSLPALDIATLRDRDINVGDWPPIHPLHVLSPGTLPPMMQLLLLADQEFRASYRSIRGLDLSQLADASDDELQHVQTLVWSIKNWLQEVSRNGQVAIQSRLQQVLGNAFDQEEISKLANAIPVQALAELQSRWLPDLEAELAARAEGTTMLTSPKTDDAASLIHAEHRRKAGIRSGWYLDSDSTALRYRPSGHADVVMKQLLDFSIRRISDPLDASLTGLALQENYHRLSNHFSVGRCSKCHSIDSEDGQYRIHWQPYSPDPDQRGFTHFSHGPHLTALDNEACTTCHSLTRPDDNKGSTTLPSYHDFGGTPTTDCQAFVGDFTPLQKANCVPCHSPQTQHDSCLTCHQYHVH